jgi:hypothetical protein
MPRDWSFKKLCYPALNSQYTIFILLVMVGMVEKISCGFKFLFIYNLLFFFKVIECGVGALLSFLVVVEMGLKNSGMEC